MWSDDETEWGFPNFSGVADTVAEIIVDADGRPISISVSGAWGVGKSSMMDAVSASAAFGRRGCSVGARRGGGRFVTGEDRDRREDRVGQRPSWLCEPRRTRSRCSASGLR